MTAPEEQASEREQLEAEWQRAFAWVEERLGGRITHFERQPRWRPAFYLDVQCGDETLPVYFRGDRGSADHGVYPLEHEFRILEVLAAENIPVPKLYGFCEEPRGIVMERCPGRANLATAESPEEERAVLDDFVDILARMHALDVSKFEAVGIERPKDTHALGLGDFGRWEHAYRSHKLRPDPSIEFTIQWVKENTPSGRRKVSFLQGDSGQFLFEKGRVTTLIDLELAYLGDPLADLAGLFTRDLSEPMGDLHHALARYGEQSGEPVDPRVVMYHGVRFGICTPMSIAHLVAKPTPELDLVQYLAWYWVYCRTPLEWIALLEDIRIEPWTPPEPRPTWHSSGHDFLAGAIDAIPAEDTFARYQRDVAARSASYLRRAEDWGPELAADDLAEAASILGSRPADWQQADAALEERIAQGNGDPGLHQALIAFFLRRCQRNEWLLAPVLRELTDASFQTPDLG